MTSAFELGLMSLTGEELDDAIRIVAWAEARWKESRRRAEAEGRDAMVDAGFHGTEGPSVLFGALDVAFLEEQAQRGGVDAWAAGEPLDGHPAATRIRYFTERIALNPDQGVRPRLSAAGILERVCPGCGEAKPLTVAFWVWQDATLSTWCRACLHPPRAAQAAAVATREALIAAEEAAAPAPVPVEPFTADELVPVPDSPMEFL